MKNLHLRCSLLAAILITISCPTVVDSSTLKPLALKEHNSENEESDFDSHNNVDETADTDEVTKISFNIWCSIVAVIPLIPDCATPSDSNEGDGDSDSNNSVENVVTEDTNELLPTPDELFNLAKELIKGYPAAFVSSAIDTFCSAAISADAINPKITPDISEMNFQLRTPCGSYFFPLLESDKILQNPHFDPEKEIVIIVSGWQTNSNDSELLQTVGKAYLCRGDANVIGVDTADFVDTLYIWSALNTDEIGKNIADGLEEMVNVVPLEKIHLIGHSLGAHIVGSAGRYFYLKTGKRIRRITGLDPAKPCFNEGDKLTGLQLGDAVFIDVVHSNSGVLGKGKSTGNADFFPAGGVPLTPGCDDISCAHSRSFEYYAESVYPGNEENFMSKRCSSLSDISEGNCRGRAIPMGYAVPHNSEGDYFLDVESESPFGLGASTSREEEHQNCGLCPDDKKLKKF